MEEGSCGLLVPIHPGGEGVPAFTVGDSLKRRCLDHANEKQKACVGCNAGL